MAGGRLHFWTDVEEYFHSAVAIVRERTQLAGPFDVAELDPAARSRLPDPLRTTNAVDGPSRFWAEFRTSGAAGVTESGTGDSA